MFGKYGCIVLFFCNTLPLFSLNKPWCQTSSYLVGGPGWGRVGGGHLEPLILPRVIQEQVVVQEHLKMSKMSTKMCDFKSILNTGNGSCINLFLNCV